MIFGMNLDANNLPQAGYFSDSIFVDEKDINGNLKNIFLKEKIGENEHQIIIAKEGKIKKDNSKNGDMFLNCRSCKTIITNDWRSKFDTRYCADCL